ncbi:S-layer homology domain-containing protein [Olsenella sp. An293]|uniref:S-layer homology domain-containing protein n=1 Tax=Olsenella sp. An293 TaxID=1965626 RepID=UPI00117D532F|nr:S-layer homology domain-containing protein [Olsenella sp. An293]
MERGNEDLYGQRDREDVSARADLSRFGDAASVSGWAADAMSWAVAEGVFNGNGQGLLEPGRAIARSELCAVLMNWEARE